MRVVYWRLWWILNMVVSLCSGCGRWSSLHEFRIACLQMELPMLIDVMIYVVHCVTVL